MKRKGSGGFWIKKSVARQFFLAFWEQRNAAVVVRVLEGKRKKRKRKRKGESGNLMEFRRMGVAGRAARGLAITAPLHDIKSIVVILLHSTITEPA